ncbi:MAG: hypothetical protein WCP96_16190 [Methylococcaceae bacterium]
MTLTRSFKETVMARIERDEEFRDALFREGFDCLLFGDVDTGRPYCATILTPQSALKASVRR